MIVWTFAVGEIMPFSIEGEYEGNMFRYTFDSRQMPTYFAAKDCYPTRQAAINCRINELQEEIDAIRNN